MNEADLNKRGVAGARKATLSVVPSSINEEARTFEITFATETPVKRRDWDGAFMEVLSLDPKHVRMGRFASGRAPFLVQHNSWNQSAHVGVIESARIVNGEGRATVRMVKDDPDADKAWNKIRQGVLTSVSVGYDIHKMEKIAGGDGQMATFRATDWEPYEASAVSIPADPKSQIRSLQETPHMDNENENQNSTQTPEQIRAAERARVSTILTLGRRHGMPENDIQRFLDNPGPGAKTEFHRYLLDMVATRSEQAGGPVGPSGVVEYAGDYEAIRGRNAPYTPPVTASQRGGHDDFRAAAADALVMRAGISLAKPHAAASDLRHTSTVEIARTCLSRTGRPSFFNLSPAETIKRAFSTSDFPQILTGATGAAVRRGYETEPSTHRVWVSTETVPDFREQARPILGSVPKLEKIPELSEYTYGSMSEDSASFRVEKFGKAIALSWELLVNDRLGAWLRVKPALGQAARRLEADLVYSMFAENGGAGPTMQDGVNLFHATHKNITAAAALDADGLSAARTLLRKQTALGGGFLALAPRFLLLPVELEQKADMLLAASTRTTSGNTESDRPEWIGRLVPVIEPRLAATSYYLLAAGDQIDTAVMALLDDNAEGPVIEEEAEFSNDSYRMKVRHVIGSKVLDWRGMIKVPLAP